MTACELFIKGNMQGELRDAQFRRKRKDRSRFHVKDGTLLVESTLSLSSSLFSCHKAYDRETIFFHIFVNSVLCTEKIRE